MGRWCLFIALAACTSKGTTPSTGQDSQDSAPPGWIDDDPVGESSRGLDQLGDLDVKNVVVLHADTLRADALVHYGYERHTTPNLSAAPFLAVRGYTATAPWTMPSTLSALTGLSPERHGAVSKAGSGRTTIEVTLAERLQEAGFATLSMSGNKVVGEDPVMTRGFDTSLLVEDLDDVEAQHAASLWAESQAALEALDPDQPFFLWIQAMDTHTPHRVDKEFMGMFADYSVVPYDPGDDTTTQFEKYQRAWNEAATDEERAAITQSVRDVYDELVYQSDDVYGQIFAWLEAQGHLEDTLVVLSADHGETLGDVGQPIISHVDSVRPELINLPLVFYHPDLDSAWTTCRSSNVDLAPTVLELLDLDPIDAIDGFAMQGGCRELSFASLYDEDTEVPTLKWLTVMDDRYKLDWSCLEGVASFYDLSVDPTALSPLPLAPASGVTPYWGALEAYLELASSEIPGVTCARPEYTDEGVMASDLGLDR